MIYDEKNPHANMRALYACLAPSLLNIGYKSFFLWVLCCLLGFSCDSFSVWYTSYMHLDTHVRWSHLFILVYGIRFVSVIVCIIFCFYLFSSWGNIPLQRYWSLPCEHGLHCSDELTWEQQTATHNIPSLANQPRLFPSTASKLAEST